MPVLNAPDENLLGLLQAALPRALPLFRQDGPPADAAKCQERRLPGRLPLLLAIGGLNRADRTLQFIAACNR